jgi:hypothetical protein
MAARVKILRFAAPSGGSPCNFHPVPLHHNLKLITNNPKNVFVKTAISVIIIKGRKKFFNHLSLIDF